jgi:hypothetical protein
MRSDPRGSLRLAEPPPDHDEQRFDCSRCGRAVESDVLIGDDLLAALGWARVGGRVLCVACRRAAGEPPDLAARILGHA